MASRPGRLVLTIPTPSADGKYYSRYPAGNAPGVGGPPTIRQQNTNQWPGQSANGDPQSLTETLAMTSNVVAQNSLFVLLANYNLGGVGGACSITDSQSNTYTKIGQTDNDDPSANMSLYAFICPRLSASGALTLTGHWNQPEWQALLALEMTGLAASPVLAYNGRVQTAGSTTADSLTTNSVAGGSNLGIILAFSLNGTDQNLANSGGVGSPNTGTGWTAINSGVINWNGEENSFVGPACAAQYKTYASAMGTVTPTFTPKKAGESYVSIAVALSQ
jgi:hypothetical protein